MRFMASPPVTIFSQHCKLFEVSNSLKDASARSLLMLALHWRLGHAAVYSQNDTAT